MGEKMNKYRNFGKKHQNLLNLEKTLLILRQRGNFVRVVLLRAILGENNPLIDCWDILKVRGISQEESVEPTFQAINTNKKL